MIPGVDRVADHSHGSGPYFLVSFFPREANPGSGHGFLSNGSFEEMRTLLRPTLAATHFPRTHTYTERNLGSHPVFATKCLVVSANRPLIAKVRTVDRGKKVESWGRGVLHLGEPSCRMVSSTEGSWLDFHALRQYAWLRP